MSLSTVIKTPLQKRLDVVQLILEAFDSSQGVADYLAAQGIKGRRCSPNGCPLALWVNKLPGIRHPVSVGYFAIWIGPSGQYKIDQPSVVRLFTEQFDDGEFPELESARD